MNKFNKYYHIQAKIKSLIKMQLPILWFVNNLLNSSRLSNTSSFTRITRWYLNKVAIKD